MLALDTKYPRFEGNVKEQPGYIRIALENHSMAAAGLVELADKDRESILPDSEYDHIMQLHMLNLVAMSRIAALSVPYSVLVVDFGDDTEEIIRNSTIDLTVFGFAITTITFDGTGVTKTAASDQIQAALQGVIDDQQFSLLIQKTATQEEGKYLKQVEFTFYGSDAYIGTAVVVAQSTTFEDTTASMVYNTWKAKVIKGRGWCATNEDLAVMLQKIHRELAACCPQAAKTLAIMHGEIELDGGYALADAQSEETTLELLIESIL